MREIYINNILCIASFYFLVAISPGPDMAITIRNSLYNSKKNALASVLGTCSGIFIHSLYAILGLGYIIQKSPLLFQIIQGAGGAYLLYLGIKCFYNQSTIKKFENVNKNSQTIFKSYKSALLVNLLNPIVIVIFIGLLGSYVTLETPIFMKITYILVLILIDFLWFGAVAMFFSYSKVKNTFYKMGKYLDWLTGMTLIFLGLRTFYTIVNNVLEKIQFTEILKCLN